MAANQKKGKRSGHKKAKIQRYFIRVVAKKMRRITKRNGKAAAEVWYAAHLAKKKNTRDAELAG